ncbi:MAG TPA: bifunctional oligoribonuclease/PAP phosphatase NrnA [Herpetosiphonaceae bacterium]
MLYTNAEMAAPAIAECLRDKHHILLITHVNPDGDAVGSLLGLGLYWEQIGYQVTMLAPTPLPNYARRLKNVERIQVYSETPILPPTVDLIALVDTGDVQRIARVYQEQAAYVNARPLIIIDHHATNTGEGSINLVDPTRSSNCELIYELLRAWDARITPDIATALLMGITTDTQSFKTSNTTPSALRAAADLIELQANRAVIMRDVYSNIPFETAKLLSLSLAALKREGPIAWTYVSQAMQHQTGANDDATDEVTDYISNLGGMKATVLFKERRDGLIKISLRSVPGVDVSAVAQQFGGGGHRQAAGATLDGPLEDAERRVLAALHAAIGGARDKAS